MAVQSVAGVQGWLSSGLDVFPKALQVLAMLEAGLAYIVYLGMRSTGWMVWTSERYMEFRPQKLIDISKLSSLHGSGCT